MNHIANCMKPDGERASVHITHETSFFRMSVSPQPQNAFHLLEMSNHLPRRSRSLREIQATKETILSPPGSLAKSPSLANLTQQPATSRYQLWPSSRSPVGQPKNNSSFDKISALSVGRSSTSLSDTAVLPESVPFWQRSSALARRRKVSVPELGNTMTTVQESAIDSRKFYKQYNQSTPAHIVQPQFLVDHRCVRSHMRLLAMKGQPARQAPTGGLDRLAMPWSLVLRVPLPASNHSNRLPACLQIRPRLPQSHCLPSSAPWQARSHC
jgi:hypothetical protein